MGFESPQREEVDSLKNILPTLEDNNQVLTVLNRLTFLYAFKDSTLSRKYGRISVELASEVKDQNKLAIAYKNMGISYDLHGEYASSLRYFLLSLKHFKEVGDIKGAARALNNCGIVYKNLMQYDKSIEYYTESLELKRELGDKKGVAYTEVNIGEVQTLIGDYQGSLQNYDNALMALIEINDKHGLAQVYNNIGQTYQLTGDEEQAVEFLLTSLDFEKEIGNTQGELQSHLNISNLYLQTGNLSKALSHIKDASLLAREMDNKNAQVTSLSLWASYYQQEGKYKRAFNYLRKYQIAKDSIYSDDLANKIAQLNAVYESEKGKKENEYLKLENTLQQNQIRWLIALAVIVIVAFIIAGILAFRLSKSNIRIEAQNKLLQDKDKENVLANDTLSEKNRELKQFSYVVSHDLKTPIRGIYKLSQWIEDDLGTANHKELSDNLKLLRSNILRMEDLIEGILEYSEIGFKNVSYELVDLNQLFQEVKESQVLPENFEIIIQNGTQIIRAKRILLYQIFINLLSNAVKYNDKKKGVVHINYRNIGSHHEFELSDNGPGIDKKHYDKIFGIFQTIKKTKGQRNTGIGLSIVKKIVTVEGGQITVESKIGQGTTFRFTTKNVDANTSIPMQSAS